MPVRCLLAEGPAFLTLGLPMKERVALVGRVRDPDAVPAAVERSAPDVVLVSFEPPSTGIRLVEQLAGVPVVLLLPAYREEDVALAVLAGTAAVAPRSISSEELAALLEHAVRGRISVPHEWMRSVLAPLGLRRRAAPPAPGGDLTGLTPREREIVQLLVDGMPNKVLARALGIAPQTAKNHLRNVMLKTGVESRLQLCTWAMRRGVRPRSQEAGAPEPTGAQAGATSTARAAFTPTAPVAAPSTKEGMRRVMALGREPAPRGG